MLEKKTNLSSLTLGNRTIREKMKGYEYFRKALSMGAHLRAIILTKDQTMNIYS